MGQKLTAAQLAEKLHVRKQTILTWARQGKIPSQRLSIRPVLFDEEEVEKALKYSSLMKESKKMPT
jgi:excisionase family DNA binding protein